MASTYFSEPYGHSTMAVGDSEAQVPPPPLLCMRGSSAYRWRGSQPCPGGVWTALNFPEANTAPGCQAGPGGEAGLGSDEQSPRERKPALDMGPSVTAQLLIAW